MAFLDRNVPRRLRMRWVTDFLLAVAATVAAACPDAADGERSGIVSTLVDANSSFGVEIWLGLIRLRTGCCCCCCCAFSPSLGMDGDLRRAAIAASARRCTSIASSALTAGLRGAAPDDGIVSCTEGVREGELGGSSYTAVATSVGWGERSVGETTVSEEGVNEDGSEELTELERLPRPPLDGPKRASAKSRPRRSGLESCGGVEENWVSIGERTTVAGDGELSGSVRVFDRGDSMSSMTESKSPLTLENLSLLGAGDDGAGTGAGWIIG
jgi:hypothetical protein